MHNALKDLKAHNKLSKIAWYSSPAGGGAPASSALHPVVMPIQSNYKAICPRAITKAQAN